MVHLAVEATGGGGGELGAEGSRMVRPLPALGGISVVDAVDAPIF